MRQKNPKIMVSHGYTIRLSQTTGGGVLYALFKFDNLHTTEFIWSSRFSYYSRMGERHGSCVRQRTIVRTQFSFHHMSPTGLVTSAFTSWAISPALIFSPFLYLFTVHLCLLAMSAAMPYTHLWQWVLFFT